MKATNQSKNYMSWGYKAQCRQGSNSMMGRMEVDEGSDAETKTRPRPRVCM